VLRQKDSRSIISSTYKDVLCNKVASYLSLFVATLMARSTGIFGNKETTSNETNTWSALRVLPLSCHFAELQGLPMTCLFSRGIHASHWQVTSSLGYLSSHDCKFRSSLMKTLDCSVETLGLDYNSTGLCNHLFKPDCSQRNMIVQIWLQWTNKLKIWTSWNFVLPS
jgi:hypothetical protein